MMQFLTVAQMKLAKLKTGVLVKTQGYTAAGDGLGAIYLIVAPQAFDAVRDHELANSNIAVLQNQQLLSEAITHDMGADTDYTVTAAENKQGHVSIKDTSVFLTTTRNIVVADTERVFLASNTTAQSLVFKTAAGTGSKVDAGVTGRLLFCDGTNVEAVDVLTAAQQLLSEQLTHNMTSDADYTLTDTENLKSRINITDTGTNLTVARNIFIAVTQRIIVAENNALQDLTFKTATGTGITIEPGESFILECDGTNIVHVPEAWYRSADAGGTADVITSTFDPPIKALRDRIRVRVRALGANTITGVTYNPDGLGAEPVVMNGNQALLIGSIPGVDFVMDLERNDANSSWELMNSATPGAGLVQTSAYATGSVDQAALGAAAAGQGELKTTTGTVSDTGAGPGALYTLPGGQYGFYPETQYVRTTGAPVDPRAMIYYDPTGVLTSTYTAFIYLDADNGGGNGTLSAQQRYVQASPPYFDADGELIGRYIFAKIDKNSGQVVGVYSAQEAPWHYNGPTDIRGKLGKDGKKYRERRDMSAVPFTHAQAKSDIAKLKEYHAAFAAAPVILEEITQEIKDADMILIPRPMEPAADTVVVMLDPVSDLNHQLCEMSAHDGFSINELLHSGLITIDNNPLVRAGPPGVDVMGFRWK